MSWFLRFLVALGVDLFDFTIGRFLFVAPFSGEIIGIVIGYALFGPKAFWYLLEALDPTEQLDGFIPTATLIALAARNDERFA
ncbi:hypothetical protein [Hyphococcus sp.]|uniref:hypothetical protein n=1 Tax=Hyphococcus sp. TaxID=2038636 RepID=UPI003D09FB00